MREKVQNTKVKGTLTSLSSTGIRLKKSYLFIYLFTYLFIFYLFIYTPREIISYVNFVCSTLRKRSS